MSVELATAASNTEIPVLKPEKSWVGTLCAYFRDFLDTDFQKVRAPKRSISARDASNNLTGVALSKYPELVQDIWSLIAKPFDKSFTLSFQVRRGKYKSRLSKNLHDVIVAHIKTYEKEDALQTVSQLKVVARELLKKYVDDPQRIADELNNQIRSSLLLSIINPLLGALDKAFSKESLAALDGIFNLEEELGRQLTENTSEAVSPAVASAIVHNNFEDLDALISDLCEPSVIRAKFITYFEGFATNDFFNELTELRSTLKLKDNFQIYVYACTLRYGSSSYPLFYFPIDVSLENSIYTIKIDPHLLINKKAVEFATTELARHAEVPIIFSVPDRIIYISEGGSILASAQAFLDDLTASLSLKGAIDLHSSAPQKIFRNEISIDNTLYFAAFETADESLLNDYEELLTALGGVTAEASDLEDLIKKFMEEDPQSFEEKIDDIWRSTKLEDRLVYESPVPLNEEQRKILSALSQDACRFVAVEGPPGTGKSHTITACVFEAILKGKSVLILSDKKEALDVAEEKIRTTLARVRNHESFQDPILRLGKQGSSYTKILSPKTISQLKNSAQVAKDNEHKLTAVISSTESRIKEKIIEQEKAQTSINLESVYKVQANERKIAQYLDSDSKIYLDEVFINGVIAAQSLAEVFTENWLDPIVKILDRSYSPLDFVEVLTSVRSIEKILVALPVNNERKKIGNFPSAALPDFERLVSRLENARLPLIGYLFSKAVLREIEHELRTAFEYSSEKQISKQLQDLKRIASELRTLHSNLTTASADGSLKDAAFFIAIRGHIISMKNVEKGLASIEPLCLAISKYQDEFLSIGISVDDFSTLRKPETIQRLNEIYTHALELKKLEEQFLSIPEFDYTAQLAELEHLQTQRLANTLDESVVRFANEKKNQAQQIKDIISKKQLFPKELFKELQAAFPVIISGIREYAEYIPLEKNLFDLIIIDEASQVSIAQALPAFIRARKVVVLGDRNQFSNVKTERASIAVNQSYKAQVIEQFKKQENPDIAQLNQIKLFDIKTSVLQFVERIANYRIMLRKHFRGYPELIGFSSKYFYNNQLQAVKIRGKSIDQVIEFLEVTPSSDIVRNTNNSEAIAILELLQAFGSEENAPECCVITPHTEQQKLISKLVNSIPNAPEFIDKLNLKIFTFDTCQGEERDIVIYSMVATETIDRLNFIFAKDLAGSDDIEESLRLQRLNVGFSRAKEKMIVVHSKPLSMFKGGIATALNHYWAVLERGKEAPSADDVDPSSPMERKVLGWLQQLPILDELSEQVELDAQFELGAYLRQIDPTYSYPKYKVDFLLKIAGQRKSMQIIIEYDGFKEHFTDQGQVHEHNYEHYMRPEDVERQKVLESYGYKFLRINRFNLGKDPIATLDKRIRTLISDMDLEYSPPEFIEEHNDLINDLESGEAKVCPECNHIRSKQMYFDPQLQNGKGGFGRICMECKGISAKELKNRQVSAFGTVPPAGKRIYLRCPFSQKDECKKLGGRWDPIRKLWYINEGADLTAFNRWLS